MFKTKACYYVDVFDYVKVIYKDGNVVRLYDIEKEDNSRDESVSFIQGVMKVPDQLPEKIAKQLITVNLARKISNLEAEMQGRLIQIIKDIPWNRELFFENFVEILIKKGIWDKRRKRKKGKKYQLIEIGPRVRLSSFFQLLPTKRSLKTQVKINFLEEPNVLKVYYDMNIELQGEIFRELNTRFTDIIDNHLIPIVKLSIKEALEKTENER